jgi:CxxC motif-containing protein (DUF1111 family)
MSFIRESAFSSRLSKLAWACGLSLVPLLVGGAMAASDTAKPGDDNGASRRDAGERRKAASDPGPRRGGAAAGEPLAGLNRFELAAFKAGRDDFVEVEGVPDGLGPRMNLDSCVGCHLQPAVGGSSPPINPQVEFATRLNASNVVPRFVRLHGPVREARFVKNPDGTPDGGVQSLFTITSRNDAGGCVLQQPNFEVELARGNVIFRIPTPLFGGGLIEQIPDRAIMQNINADLGLKQSLGIAGRPNIVLAFETISGQPNRNGNDGTFGRFGWKAQNKSLLNFAAEAYNVEMGITNEGFQTERDETPQCQFVPTPNDVTPLDAPNAIEGQSAIQKFAFFMRFLAPPQPSEQHPGGADSINQGRQLFTSVGCGLCHTPSLQTGKASVAALRDKEVKLYSDLLLHDMGDELADGVRQGQAGPREFRTAPLWGLGQRLFFLHDGRTADLREAIQAHQSRGSEANAVTQRFGQLGEPDKQHLLNFLRAL